MKYLPRSLAPLLLAFAAVLSTGCASLPDPPPQAESHALADPRATPLGQLVAKLAPASGPRSGFRTLIAGDESFDARIALIDNATKTLDFQCYIVEDDVSARLVAQHLRAAAERGVRVRVLLDDLSTTGSDDLLRTLIDQPGIEVRLFNPFPVARGSTVLKVLASLNDVSRINKRMHNKLMVADNALAITGGRNLSDAYFIMSAKSNFVDLDLLAAGAAVRPLSASFDRFWNDPLAYPAKMFIKPKAEKVAAPASAASAPGEAVEANPLIEPGANATPREKLLTHEIAAGRIALTWAPARVLADAPTKFQPTDPNDAPDSDESLVDDMERLLLSAKQSVMLISPYFVPGKHGMEVLHQLRDRGVKVIVLTNSLAANDAPLVHLGYARYRKELLKMGVTLAELKPSVGGGVERRLGSFGSSTSRLHAKALAVDDEWALIGTMNFDPRSNALNSEMGVLMRSPAIAHDVSAFGLGLSTYAAYILSLDDEGDLRWGDPVDKTGQLLDDEPGASAWLKAWLKVLAPFAPEEML